MADERTPTMGIAELAERAGVTPRTIRFYVAEGLLPPPGGRGQQRSYSREHLDRLGEIRRLKASYLPLQEIRRRLHGPGQVATDAPPPSASAIWPGAPTRAVATAAVVSAVAAQRPFGFGGTSQIGRIEIYEPVETVWHRHTLAPGIELHYRETTDPALAAVIERLIRAAGAILDESPGDAPQKGSDREDRSSPR